MFTLITMISPDPPKLYFGPYSTPRLRPGRKETCEVRGDVIIVELSSGRIPWPLARLPGKSPRGLLVYKGLAKAIRLESATAVCYWWGVNPTTISRWRLAMGVDAHTAGSRKLRAEHGKRNWDKVRPKLWAKLHDKEVHAKIAAAKRGKPRPPHVVEAMRLANIGKKHTAETRAKMSAAHKRKP